ncbi:MAG TPA: cysteine rich repeat-containing protein [Hyphomicrobiaceae bacterium]|nr:cysteine rich repeat-containing protein [Hyphomicrobiaceae bacterium]
MSPKSLGVALALTLLPWTVLAQSPTPAARDEARQKLRAACAADVQKFCATVERGKGALRACLESHETQLSDGCKAARAERAAARAKDKS